MPELPDLESYVNALRSRLIDVPLTSALVRSPFFVRTYDPPLRAVFGERVTSVLRRAKRIIFRFSNDVRIVIHLMIAGRFRWLEGAARAPQKLVLIDLSFPSGHLLVTEASTKKRASLHVVQGQDAEDLLIPPGVEPLEISRAEFGRVLTSESHTVKRALTDPRLFAAIGNAYSDEILFTARLSPLKRVGLLREDEIDRLFSATRDVLIRFTELLTLEARKKFPERVTAFRPEMAVHGKHGKPCIDCGSPVQRIAYADNECNYCATCQTDGRLLADRALSRLLGADFPRSLDDLEEHIASRRIPGGAGAKKES